MNNAYLLVALTIAFTVYGQVVLKWQMGVLAPQGLPNRPADLLAVLLTPWVISAFFAAFLASLCWMGALSRLPLSKAYPFMALSFPTVAVLAVLLFHEELNTPKILGTSLIVLGAIILSRAPA
ncbi:EamA family transporter [Silanimonas sp.]|jgi:multidrug transporter EmrE-like cation transporter|uniref:EamA family transporter n=1 Tax=Silanimonas sp. TaxID=1929290 RepID=UPI0022BF7076|nr:EamA family transporter [Silanimonas sp.]MCZ8114213.1 EamA family transporter [Silanimonas sp.]